MYLSIVVSFFFVSLISFVSAQSCEEIKEHELCVNTLSNYGQCLWCERETTDDKLEFRCLDQSEAQMFPDQFLHCSGKNEGSNELHDNEIIRLFNLWKVQFKKRYESDREESLRFDIFQQNLNRINIHNQKKDKTFKMGLNKFADFTWQEFKSKYLTQAQNCSATSSSPSLLESPSTITNYRMIVPESKDWRDEGAVSPVKDQGNCGSCWTFSTTGCLESHNFLYTGKMTLLSEQQLIDCAYGFNNFGCDGGLPSQAFEYIRFNGGLDTEYSYPYVGKDGTCKFSSDSVGATVSHVFNITYQDEAQLLYAVGLIGPVSIAYEVIDDFMLYTSGVYSSNDCSTSPDDVNHAVLAVGYNTDQTSGDYWIVKNSWGIDWGIDGYFYIARGQNMCGLADCASFPIIQSFDL